MFDVPRKLVGWRAWCSLGHSSYEIIQSGNEPWIEVHDVLVIILYREDGTRHIMQGHDFYWCTGCESWDSCFGCGSDYKLIPKEAVVSSGREVELGVYEEVVQEALGDRWL